MAAMLSTAETAHADSFCTERMVPEEADRTTFWEHIYRYQFAAPYVLRKRVLDIACGDGYGSAALLAAGAESVIGIDISEDICRRARRKYDVDARSGSAEKIPLPSSSIDIVVSFETIEHLQQPEKFMDECVRVLAPQGMLIISTPNADITQANGVENPYHVREMNEREFRSALDQRFSSWRMFTQRPKTAAFWSRRSLAADISFWHRFRRMNRLSRELTSRYCPHIVGDVGEDTRRSITKLIAANNFALFSSVDPFAVRPSSWLARERPHYFVAVAKNPLGR
jgi:2-polyprenyl-3-methyl-5-hydroxy-6-metoxy-1,4-benzoquinol methylase